MMQWIGKMKLTPTITTIWLFKGFKNAEENGLSTKVLLKRGGGYEAGGSTVLYRGGSSSAVVYVW